ncbi:AraC-like DNA-binding protein [Pedobacter sp. AK013]|uniref:helix-turn-helix domain-containing protein n=1 Tax=Pedobacter sp. AK013 TaxID=2723071 RepID=UPI0017C60064|nr:helix-turn-helix domain-containing protein [Pedobacter sp. AK013]MBB6239561.1 AraC-like DNA-binding protein [Pedobacter sp. AK013]
MNIQGVNNILTDTHNISTYHKIPILDGLELLNAKKHTIDFPFHTHNTFNIALILNQTFYTKLNDKFLQAPIGTLSITNPHEVHATPCDNKLGNSFFTFYVSPDVLKTLNKGCDVFFEDKIIYDRDLVNIFYYLSRHFNNPEVNLEKELLNALEKLVARYASSMYFEYKKTALFQSFLSEDLMEKFSLTDTAKRFGLDKYKFLRLFKHETGLTPNNYILLKRIEKCKKLITKETDLMEVAIETGFYDVAHLSRHFKRFTGVTPSEYKRA